MNANRPRKKRVLRYILEQDTMFDYSKAIKKKEKARTAEFIKEKKKTGISPDELWSLDYAVAIFLVPRLKLFIERTIGYPTQFKDFDEWKKALKKMLYSMKKIANDDVPLTNNKRFKEGIELFGKYFLDLWW